MNNAIAQLDITAQVAEHNAPISEAEGQLDQAELQNAIADDCREAIAQLEGQA